MNTYIKTVIKPIKPIIGLSTAIRLLDHSRLPDITQGHPKRRNCLIWFLPWNNDQSYSGIATDPHWTVTIHNDITVDQATKESLPPPSHAPLFNPKTLWSPNLPPMDSEHTIKGEIRCKMDLGYVWYDNELECSFWSKKAQIDGLFSWLFLADSIKTL